jgi:DNA helicase HerA-like ATPase
MILGKIFGKITTNNFQFLVENETRKFEFVQALHKVYEYVLCQVVEIERTDKDIARCIVIGYKDDKDRIKPIRIPFDQGTEVLRAEDTFIKEMIKLESSVKSAFIGKLEGKDIDILLDLEKLLTKHIAVLAKSGAGKSYAVGVLIEEILDKKIPILVIDPHGEYSSISSPNEEEKETLKKYGLSPKKFHNVYEYGDNTILQSVKPLRISSSLSPVEITQLIPGKLSNTQMGILYAAMKNIEHVNFTTILLEMEKEENNSKWAIVNNLEYLNNLHIFSDSYTPYNELIQSGRCTIINLKGIPPDVQEIIVYKLLKDLFELRKQEKIPPFFTVIEEAHNYCPERSFGETRCSKVLRTVASEGRKFGLGLCIISQRPARVDKSVLSQCTTQIILKVTNPNDLKAISSSVEGITAESEDEIKNLSIGTALVTGIVDMPLFVNIRPRMTLHGGHAAEIMEDVEKDVLKKIEEFEEKEILPIVKPQITKNDLKLMHGKDASQVLVPGFMVLCEDKNGEYNLLVDSVKGEVVVDLENYQTKILPQLEKLSQLQINVLHAAFQLKEFLPADLIKKGLPLSSGEELSNLQKLGYIVFNDKYAISDKYIFTQLKKNASYSKVEFISVNYDEKREQKITADEMREKVSKFTKVRDMRECFILKHELL